MTTDQRVEALTRELMHTLDEFSKIMEKYALLTGFSREYLTSEDVADRCKVHSQTVDKWVRVYGLKCYMIGKGPKFLWPDVQEFIERTFKHGDVLEEWHGATRRAS
jgi:hypothetical protein